MKVTPVMIWPEGKMERLYRAALRVLRETGFRIDHPWFLDEFEKRGMRVDRTSRRVSIMEELVNDLLHTAPDVGRVTAAREGRTHGFGLSGSYPRLYDWPSRSSRPGRTADLLELIRVFSAIPEFGSIGRILTLSDVPARIEPIVATAEVIKHSPRPCGGEVYQADNIPYLVELGEIATGRSGCADYVASCTFVVPPLKMTMEEGRMVIEKGRRGITAVAGTMPSSGATAPATREGTVVIELAEVITLWLCYRMVNPEIELGAICASSSFEMKSGTCCFSSPEAVLQDCAAAQILRAWFGADARTSNAYVDAKVPGAQAIYEKMFKAWWAWVFQGDAYPFGGLLEAGQGFCAAQALVDMDLWKTVNAMLAEGPDEADEVPFDEIARVCAENGTFLDAEHTLRLYRDVLHVPAFLDRSPRRSDQEEATKAAELYYRPRSWG